MVLRRSKRSQTGLVPLASDALVLGQVVTRGCDTDASAAFAGGLLGARDTLAAIRRSGRRG